MREELYRGPSAEAAVMCAATPTFTDFPGSTCGPLVSCRQDGFEHLYPTRFASRSLIGFGNSSLTATSFRPLLRLSYRMFWRCSSPSVLDMRLLCVRNAFPGKQSGRSQLCSARFVPLVPARLGVLIRHLRRERGHPGVVQGCLGSRQPVPKPQAQAGPP